MGNSCRLLLLGADVVEDKTAYDGSKCACDHSHAELNDDVHYLTSLLKRKLTAVKGSGIGEIISEKFQLFNTPISKKMTVQYPPPMVLKIFLLTKFLREMESDGIVIRRELISEPPKVVKYSLTSLGKELIPALNEIYAWGQKVMRHES